MESEGGGEAAVNPLALLRLTNSIVLFRFLAAEALTSPMSAGRYEASVRRPAPRESEISLR